MPSPVRITRRSIVDAAVDIIDNQGLDALTIRRLGAALGVRPSALYWHFPSMDELKAEIAWEVTREVALLPRTATSWQAAAEERWLAFLRALLRHPNAIPLLVDVPGRGVWERRIFRGFGEDLDWFLGRLEADGIPAAGAVQITEAMEAFAVGAAALSTRTPVDVAALTPAEQKRVARITTAQSSASSNIEARFQPAIHALLVGLGDMLRATASQTGRRRAGGAKTRVS